MALTENLFVGDGSTVLYSFTFPYIDESDIKVSLDGTETTEYTLANATTVEFNTAPALDVAIRIFRETTIDSLKATFFPGSVIRAQDLNDNFEQQLFVVQEASFDNSQSAADSAAALTTAQAAETSANTALTQSNTAITDSATAVSDASAAQTAASNAETSAAQAEADAAGAVAAVSTAQLFLQVADVSAIPASPSDGDNVKVVDSTGIASFTPLTGLPVGPTYDSGLFVRLTYNVNTWEFVDYGPNDPDSRYILPGDNVSELNNDTGFITDAGVTSIVAGSNITVTNGGVGQVTINSTASGGGGGSTAGADAWATTSSAGVLGASFNIAACTKASTGIYDYTFITAMPTADYAVMATTSNFSSPELRSCSIFNRTTTGFQVRITYPNYSGANLPGVDTEHSVVVHATNAQIPDTVTQEQIESAINNPGLSAWGDVTSSGTLRGGLNISSVVRNSTGNYTVTFTTPMPSDVYAIAWSTGTVDGSVEVDTKTATGFTYETVASGINSNAPADFAASFMVTATNALPPTGGVGADAYGTFNSTGTLSGSFNIASVTKTTTGSYDVVFSSPMPDTNYTVVCNDLNRTVGAGSLTTTGFTIFVRASTTNNDVDANSASFVVHATNAQLPETITMAMWNDLVARVTALEGN